MYNYTIVYYLTLTLKFISNIYYFFSPLIKKKTIAQYCRYCNHITTNVLSCGCNAHISCLASRGYLGNCIFCRKYISLSHNDKLLIREYINQGENN